MGTDPSSFWGDPSLPVEQVSWNESQEFCRKLAAKTGKQVRLPTEAEWEYACRAGTTTPFHYGSSLSSAQANFNGNSPYHGAARGAYRNKTTPAGSFQPNAFGLHDMHGNVWEWCQDWSGPEYYGQSPANDPPGPTSGKTRVVRGGSWFTCADYCRSANRASDLPDYQVNDIGFRIVAAIP
jgi:formylglycine-generating enzyme required for sulfatase activity